MKFKYVNYDEKTSSYTTCFYKIIFCNEFEKIFNIIANIVLKCFFLHNLYCKGDITFMINIYACM